MTLYTDIRGALVTQLQTVTGLPALAHEGVPYTPVVGTPFVSYAVVAASARPRTLGTNHLILHEGTFEVSVVYPSEDGIGAAEAMADAIKAKFTADTTVTQGANTVRFRYAERRQALTQTDWNRIPVSTSFYLFTEEY